MNLEDKRVSHTVKGVYLRIRDGLPELLLLEHKVGRTTDAQKDGSVFREWPRWGMPGGRVEENETFEMALLRETQEEIGLELMEGAFEVVYHDKMRQSKKVGYDQYQNHFFFHILPPETEVGEMEENEEIVRGQFFPLDELPLPDDSLPFTLNQLRGLAGLLGLLAEKNPEAEDWLTIVQKSAYRYL